MKRLIVLTAMVFLVACGGAETEIVYVEKEVETVWRVSLLSPADPTKAMIQWIVPTRPDLGEYAASWKGANGMEVIVTGHMVIQEIDKPVPVAAQPAVPAAPVAPTND